MRTLHGGASARAGILAILGLIGIAVFAAQRRVPVGLDGYEAMNVPADNPVTPGKVALGRRLFADKRLSGDRSVACISCHLPEYGLTQGPDPSPAAYGQRFQLACPSLMNVGHQREFLWEGSVDSLEEAVHGLWLYNLATPGKGPTMEEIAGRLNSDSRYRAAFRKEFGAPANPDLVVKSIASYLRTVTANQSPWVRFYRGEQTAFSAAARRGYEVFDGKARCTNCHSGLLLTDLQYHNVGVGSGGAKPDPARFFVTKREQDRGAFKTPTLLNIARSGPYFHDQSVPTLEAAVDQMLRGGIENANLDRTNLKPAVLTPHERRDLLAFLRALNTRVDF